MTTLDPQARIGELVKDRPARSRVFENLGIDYCCGGKLTLAEACAKRGIDADGVLERLATQDAAAGIDPAGLFDADAVSLTELADHIEQTHHAYLKAELPRLGFMVRKVATVHGDRYPWMVEIDGVYARFAAEMLSHMMKEEQMLFPLIRALDSGAAGPKNAGGMSIAGPINVMEHEHQDAGNGLESMHELSDGFTPPPDACNTFRAMLDGLVQLESDTHQHVHKENNVLFPKALARERQQATKESA